jgi:hypothetical protein
MPYPLLKGSTLENKTDITITITTMLTLANIIIINTIIIKSVDNKKVGCMGTAYLNLVMPSQLYQLILFVLKLLKPLRLVAISIDRWHQ